MEQIHYDEGKLETQLYMVMKKLIKKQKKGILFWVTGLSGSGKTTISQKIKKG